MDSVEQQKPISNKNQKVNVETTDLDNTKIMVEEEKKVDTEQNDDEQKIEESNDKKKGKDAGKDKGKKKGKYGKHFVKPLSAEDEEKLNLALIEVLPDKLLTDDIDTLHIYIDGYNIIGCDRKCRDFMYKTKNTKNKARQRMIELCQHLFIDNIKNKKIKLNYNVIVHLWFDGHIDQEYTKNNKEIEIYKDIEITHTPIQYVVDDKLVDEFSKISKDKNYDKLVITADRELAIRLYDIGVYSMKSGRFYKQFLKQEN